MNRVRFTLVFGFLSSIALPAFAQDEAFNGGGQEIRYKERTEIDFDGLDVTGELVKPSGQLLLERRKADFNPLIKLRHNFDTEMKQSVDEVK